MRLNVQRKPKWGCHERAMKFVPDHCSLFFLRMCAASLLTIFAPCNQAMKQVPGMFDEDFMLSFRDNKDKLKEVSMGLERTPRAHVR